MMKLNLNRNWFQPQKIACVEIAQVNDGYVYRLSVIEKRDSEFERLIHNEQIHSFEELAELCHQHCSTLCLTFSLSKTIYRKIENSSANWKNQLAEIIPGLQEDDYFIQQYVQSNSSWLSFIRKDLISPWLSKFKNVQLQVYAVQLGPFPIREVRQVFDFSENIQSSSFSITFDAGQNISSINKGDFETAYSTEKETSEKTSNDQILLLACGVAALSNPDFGITDDIILNKKKEVIAKSKLTKLLIPLFFSLAGLAILGGICNFIFNKKVSNLRNQLAGSNDQIVLLDSLSAKIDNHKTLLNETAFVGHSRISFFTDRIANTISKEIRITDLNLFPIIIDKQGYDEKEMKKFNSEIIKISGTAKNSETYYSWLNELNKLDWIKSTDHQSYQEEKIGVGRFVMMIGI